MKKQHSKSIRTIRLGCAVAVLATLVSLAGPAPVRAQGPGDADRAREALERTDEVIGRAKLMVDETRSEKGRFALRVAVDLQQRAWNNYRGNGYRVALRLTIEARDEAWHAISLARADTRSEQNLQRVSEEARERMGSVRSLMIDSGIHDEQTEKLLEDARQLLDKSRLNAQQGQYQVALNLAVNARQIALRADEHLRGTRTMEESVERRIQTLERLLERARALGGGDERAAMELRLAGQKLEQANRLYREGRYREARQACEGCEQLLRGAVRGVPAPRAGDPAVRLEEAYRLLERAREMEESRGEPDPRTRELLERARETLRVAGEALDAGRVDEAEALMRRSRDMIREGAAARPREALTPERVAFGIAAVESMREEALNLASACPEAGAKDLAERAEEHLRLARGHADAGRLEAASAEAAIARNIYRRIGDLCAR